jgi:hypothetical protein
MGHSRFIGIFVAASLCGGALAQDAPRLSEAARAMIGTWEFSNADRDKICRFTFSADPAAGGYRLDIDKNCANVFPATRDIVGWAVDNYGGLRLLDRGGHAAIELTEAEAGIYDGFEAGQGRYVLQSAPAPPTHSAADMAGDWALVHGAGKPICTLTLANSPAGADALALTIRPGCDAGVMRFAPNAWRMDEGDLVLLSARGQSWRFEETPAAGAWQRVPESADAILLVRQ